MKTKIFLLVLCAYFILMTNQYCKGELAKQPSSDLKLGLSGKDDSTQVDIPLGEIRYSDYSTTDLIELVEQLYVFHRYAETVEAGEEALYRDLTPDQDALVRYKMAQSYEFIEDGGSLAREKYGEVLELHPDYERNMEVALRLGQLNDHIIIPGTEQNYGRAIECYKYILDNYDDPNKDSIYLEAIQANIHLGDLYSHLEKYDESNKCYERIYNCVSEQIVPLSYETFDSPNDLQLRKTWLENRIITLKNAVKQKIVANCIRPESETSIVELEKLIQKYSSDPTMLDIANEKLREVWEQIGNVDTLINDAADGSIQPADDFDEK